MNTSRREFLLGAAALVATSSFGNPIFGGWYADPQIRRYGDTYWVFPTRSDRFAAQTAFDAFSSKDMKTWTKHESILTTNEVKWARGAMWAPDAHEVDGKYYLFFSANDAYPVGGRRGDGEPQFQEKGEGEDVRLAVKAVRTDYAGWGTMRVDAPARAEDPPPSPVPAAAIQGRAETIELMPIALTQLRITLFPWTK